MRIIDETRADVNMKDMYGMTLLHCVCEAGHLQLVKFLVEERQANLNARNKDQETPLFIALNKKHLEIAKYLIFS